MIFSFGNSGSSALGIFSRPLRQIFHSCDLMSCLHYLLFVQSE